MPDPLLRSQIRQRLTQMPLPRPHLVGAITMPGLRLMTQAVLVFMLNTSANLHKDLKMLVSTIRHKDSL
jgi:hypothetical protein